MAMVNIYSSSRLKILIKNQEMMDKKNLEQKFEVDQNDRFTLLEFQKEVKQVMPFSFYGL